MTISSILIFSGLILFCFFIGLYLDKWLGTRGVFVTIFIILGVVGGAVTVYRQIIQTLDNQSQKKGNSSNGDR